MPERPGRDTQLSGSLLLGHPPLKSALGVSDRRLSDFLFAEAARPLGTPLPTLT
jgi:hypothetical protein